MIDDILMAARRYSASGFNVIPIRRGTKFPALKSWKEYQTERVEEAQLEVWFAGGKHDIGIVTGKINNLVVVDIDDPAHLQTLSDKRCSALAMAPIARTPNGFHVYFAYPRGCDQGNRASRARKIDLRGEGGYVVAPPTSGYSWLGGVTLTTYIDARPLFNPEPLVDAWGFDPWSSK